MQITDFGKAIRKARIEKDLTLSEMAKSVGATPAFLSALETGRKKIPHEWTTKIQNYLGSKGVNLPELPALADVANKSVSLEGLSPAQQMLVAGFARRTMDDSQLEQFRALLGADERQK